MKRIILCALFFILVIGSSCKHQNKLKLDEGKLKETILSEEDQLAYERQQREAHFKHISDSLLASSSGLRYKEDRSVDPNYPPHEIDIAGNLKNIRPYKLSDFASNIEYVRIQPPNDSVFHPQLKFDYLLLDDYIVATNLFGIVLYSRQGQLITTVVANKMTGIRFNPENQMITSNYGHTLIGAGTRLWGKGNKLFYPYVNSFTGQRYIMGLECGDLSSSVVFNSNQEKPDVIIGKGKVEIDLNHGLMPPMRSNRNHPVDILDSRSMLDALYSCVLDKNTYFHRKRGNHMLALYNNNGDTLTTFTKYEQVKNYTKKLKRGVDRGFIYEKNGKHYMRTDFNDTVFQILPPNRLLPVYVLNFGKYKIDKQQGIDPGVSLKGKIIPNGFAEFNGNIFVKFLKDNYDCRANRNNKSMKQFYGIYNSVKKEFALVQADSLDYSSIVLENDLDGGLAVWPSSRNSDNQNEISIPIYGKALKEHVNSDKLKQSSAPEIKKKALVKLSQEVSDDERILIIIK